MGFVKVLMFDGLRIWGFGKNVGLHHFDLTSVQTMSWYWLPLRSG